jgi:anthranilate phosphoribosyltransferase
MSALTEAIKKVATGPHLSKDLSSEEAKAAMSDVSAGDVDPVQAAIFFISLRIKRETQDENLGNNQALQDGLVQYSANVEQLLLISDPFNGFNRHCPVHAFLPAVLAASALPTLSQGVGEMGPKFGVTHLQVLSSPGVDVELSTVQARDQINDAELGWAYLDQAQATPALFALQDLCTRMIKRPSLASLKKMVMPIKPSSKTYIQIGFLQKAYPSVLAEMAYAVGFTSALIIRGNEGGVLPTLHEPANFFQAKSGEASSCVLNPANFGLSQTARGVLPIQIEEVTPAETVDIGLQALSGQFGPAFDSLVYGAAIGLWHCGLQNSQQGAADHVRQFYQSGRAKAFFERTL